MKTNNVFLFSMLMLSIALACSGNINSDIIVTDDNNLFHDSTANSGTTGTDIPADSTDNETNTNTMNIKIGDKILTATLVDNSSTEALKDALSESPITINMRDYGNMEKVGSLGRNFPRNDEQITTQAGDIILFQGNALVIYYAPNSWNFTRLGKIDNITPQALKVILGDGDITVTLSLPEN